MINRLVLNRTRALMNPGDARQFTVRILPEGLDKTFSWNSSDTQTATVSEEGVVYGYTVNGIGNFAGSFTMQLSVIRDKTFDFNHAVVKLDKKQYEYQGKPLDRDTYGT